MPPKKKSTRRQKRLKRLVPGGQQLQRGLLPRPVQIVYETIVEPRNNSLTQMNWHRGEQLPPSMTIAPPTKAYPIQQRSPGGIVDNRGKQQRSLEHYSLTWGRDLRPPRKEAASLVEPQRYEGRDPQVVRMEVDQIPGPRQFRRGRPDNSRRLESNLAPPVVQVNPSLVTPKQRVAKKRHMGGVGGSIVMPSLPMGPAVLPDHPANVMAVVQVPPAVMTEASVLGVRPPPSSSSSSEENTPTRRPRKRGGLLGALRNLGGGAS